MAEDFEGPISKEQESLMNKLAIALDVVFNGATVGPARGVGFVLLTFPYGDRDGRINYISNGAAREDMIRMFKDLVKRFEAQGVKG